MDRRWFEAGAHRYLLRIEDANPALYAKLHPNDRRHAYQNRLESLRALRAAGYQVGTGVMIGLPFLVVYLVAPKAWWAIFPAGSLLSVGVMIALTSLSLGFDAGTFAVGVMFLGLALTFWLVWLRRAKIPTSWAKYLALVMICLAFVLFMITAGFEFFWPLALIIAGLVMLLFSLRPKHTKDKEAFQKSKGDDSNS